MVDDQRNSNIINDFNPPPAPIIDNNLNNDLNLNFDKEQNNDDISKQDFFDLKFLEYDSDEDEEKEVDKPKEKNETNIKTDKKEKSENEDDKKEEEENKEEKKDKEEDKKEDSLTDDDDNLSNRCSYCGISHKARLAKCNECNRWFCNGRLEEFSVSHIVFHLTKSKHKEVYLPPENECGEMVIECYNCSTKNIFLLGFLESKEGESGFIICREPCLTTCKIDEEKFDKKKWIPLINEKKILLNWIVPEPSNEIETRLCQRANIRGMSKLEDKWEKDKLLASQERPKFLGNYLKSIKLSYNDGQDYLDIFEPLITAEEEYDKKIKEASKKTNVHTQFYKVGRRVYAKFIYPREDNEIKLVPGDELKITEATGAKKSYQGFVIEILLGEEIKLELDKVDNVLNEGYFTIEFVWKGTSFKRMLDGIYTFVNVNTSVSNYVYSKILGHNIEEKKFNYQLPDNLSVKGLPELNYYQTLGIKKALTTPLFLIQGPPGTGKTVTAAAIVYHLAKLKAGKVLVCAPSNIAADQLAEKIEKIGLQVVRLCAKSREAIGSNVEHLSLHNKVRQLAEIDNPRLAELMKMKEDDNIELNKSDHELYRKLKRTVEEQILDECEIIVTTCIASYDKRLNNYRFPIVLVDECTQAIEAECILPLIRGAKHVILIGDHNQLGPVCLNKGAVKAGLKLSLFERLVKLKVKVHLLEIQYRSHPKLSEFPSNTFYYGNLQNGVSAEERTHYNVNFPWPNKNIPTLFYHIVGKEEFSASGTSYINRSEADFIERVVTTFLKTSVKPDQIGIITPYEGQRCYLVSHLLKNGSINTDLYKEIQVASVDAFQGLEKDYIILSCVRSNEHNGIGFLDDPRRLNVALTRAKYGLVIVGNAKALASHQLWANLLNHYKANGLLVEGSLGAFKELNITLPPSRRYIPEKRTFEATNTNLNASSILGTSFTDPGNLSYDVSYNTLNQSNGVGNMISNLPSQSNNINLNITDEISNNATVSRFSEFGYTNEIENNWHFNMVKNSLRKNPLRVNNEFSMNEYEQVIRSYNQQMFQNIINSSQNNIQLANSGLIPGNLYNKFQMMQLPSNINMNAINNVNNMNNMNNINLMNNMNNMNMNKQQVLYRYGMNYNKMLFNERKFVEQVEF